MQICDKSQALRPFISLTVKPDILCPKTLKPKALLGKMKNLLLGALSLECTETSAKRANNFNKVKTMQL